ncbi:S8 family serine peptidase [Myceligenerans pegani]|uniref:S8 family serine peptidase n=1 Tax=Myceligenerans pegani TaxID=2776917 RepID=A0ABR9N485_9MICO|nr:S8 family serine peptidase [Myceligenerans sp. TRM 65318]MBE1878474.1 S8 family serine peptidase [Myceligenerans sp. TRM 65318]MBE3020745.1 S8 family serine peptidase [Myceligenerans sp. TRM 65318]
MRRTFLVGASIAAVVLFGAALPGAAADSSAEVRIESVGGQTVTDGRVSDRVAGEVPVTGTASTGGPADSAAPLVADAGDSGFVPVGGSATLLGAAFGGAAPYEFSWSAADGTLTRADSATPTFDSTGLEPGTYGVSLEVTDRSGATSTGVVKVVVDEGVEARLLDETAADTTPGATGVAPLEYRFDVVPGTARIDASLTWTNELNDYDLYLIDPSGEEAARSAAGTPQTSEATGVDGPAAGEWTLRVDRWLTATDTVTSVVTGVQQTDPRPVVAAGGPYAFALGADQVLAGTVTGGTGPVTVGWDLDGDGIFDDAEGPAPTVNLPEGRYLATLKATDSAGLERRQTTSILVAAPEVIATQTVPVTVIGIADTGINPYHEEFSAGAYPDPAVLALTDNFTRHPSEYIPGYPQDTAALPVTLGQGYLPSADESLWAGNETIDPATLYWIPGTKIVGAIDAGGSTGATSADDPHPILDDNGHGSGSASVSAGNRYGYCPTCLLVVVEGLDETVATGYPWVDITSHSFGYVGGAPVGPVVSGEEVTKEAVERGQTVLFAAGNGVGNAFDVPVSTWHSDQTGPDWNITVGAIRRDNQRAVVGDGIPVHVSAWGDGNLPSACRTGTVGQCAFGGTSAATPYTAGVFGTVLTQARAAVGDGAAGQRSGQVVASGIALDDSVYLADGELTRAELREAVLKTAVPLNQENSTSPYPYPLTAPYAGESNVLFEGYGAATPNSAKRAVDVLLGAALLPERPFEDEFFALDRIVRDSLWGGYDRDGDGTPENESGNIDLDLTAFDLTTVSGTLDVLRTVAETGEPESEQLGAPGADRVTRYLHRRVSAEPGVTGCGASINETYLDGEDSGGDLEPCFESRVTSVAAAYRPLGIFPSEAPLEVPLPAGSVVDVELYVAGETPMIVRPTGVLMATDRELGRGEGQLLPVQGSGPGGAACAVLGESCWTKYEFSFETSRPAFSGEQITFQVQLLGARSWAFGYEGAHASMITIAPADLPPTGFEFGASITSPADGSQVAESEPVTAGGSYAFPDPGASSEAGDHPVTRRVLVSVDDDAFADPLTAVLDEDTGTWSVDVGQLPIGEHVLYARAQVDQTASEVSASRFTVEPDAEVQWQIVNRNAPADENAWQPATGFADWSFHFDTADYDAPGPKTIVVRQVDRHEEIARDTARVRFE